MAGQVWAVAERGGYMYSDNLSAKLRRAVQPTVKFRQFADVKDAAIQNKKKGNSFHWDVYSNVATQGTKLAEGTAIPQTNFTITQGTMTIDEYGNSVPFTSLLDDLSEHPVTDIIEKALKDDAKKAFDFAAKAQFDATLLQMIPTSGTDTSAVTLYTNGTVTGTNGITLGREHVKTIVDLMKERDVPAFTGDDYMAIGRPSSFRGLKNSLEEVNKYTDEGFRRIVNGEVGRYENTRFVEQTNVAKKNWTLGKSDEIFFFGNDTVAEGVVTPEEMRGAIPSDYGRSRGIAWYYLGGFGIVHANAADPAQGRIFKWASQA